MMSRSKNEVRFEDSMSSGRTSPGSGTGSDKTRSDESRDSINIGDTTPRGILKSGNDSDDGSLTRQSDFDSDVFHGFSKSFLPGLHDWTTWRTQINDAMIDLMEERHRIFSYPGSVRHLRKHSRVFKNLTEPNFGVPSVISEFALDRAVHDYIHGDEGLILEAPAFVSFGIPRVKIRTNTTYTSPSKKSGRTSTSNTSIQYSARYSESELQRSKLNARYYRGIPKRAVDQTVVIVAPVGDKAIGNDNHEMETLCATMDFVDEEEEFI
ncbi:uncharacterized protein LOC121375228 isoform X2 [Gigantopelta aegis]|uniref:uncharacterized protein LOC121375228 isoform X2 n=1 Tax=Gigantopelta aegis TaxID=1735272 RepID=UPI001B88B6C3|nr:uncharacterized protein LOC121375228 isoform X2 [Gigantopelta aegis]